MVFTNYSKSFHIFLQLHFFHRCLSILAPNSNFEIVDQYLAILKPAFCSIPPIHPSIHRLFWVIGLANHFQKNPIFPAFLLFFQFFLTFPTFFQLFFNVFTFCNFFKLIFGALSLEWHNNHNILFYNHKKRAHKKYHLWDTMC